MNLSEKIYIVTGGSSGLGLAMAESLIAEGAKAIITGRNKEKLEKVASEIGAVAFHADAAKDEDIDQLFAFVMEKYGKLDGLINNAGIGGWAPIQEMSREKLREVFEVNVFGAAMMASKASTIFIEQNYGDIVNIASTASQKGYKYGSIYSASKFALRSMSQCWQAELRPHNVRVIQVNPSEVPTAFGSESRESRPIEDKKLTPMEIADVVIAALKMDRRGFIPEVSVFATNPF
ncbi:MAG: SDR family oxidoreductase [Flavobacteriales bacterium]|nr:SDR family oxidoreductase [Flavobacteriales bacterium]